MTGFKYVGVLLLSMGFVPVCAEANPLLPERRFENATLSDGSTWSSFAFTTVPGVVYRIESADALQTWTTELEVYGLGQKILMPMKELVPPSGTPYSADEHVSLIVRPAAAPSTGMVLFWPSLDDSQALTYWIDQDFGTEWQSVPFSIASAGGYSFAIFHPNDPAVAPSTNLGLVIDDSNMIAAFEANFTAIESQLAAGSSTHTGEPPADADKRFWRLHADWDVDSDGDGDPDWAEFELANDPSHPSHQWGDAFNADADGDGTLDEWQKDKDKDALINAMDAHKFDAAIEWEWINHEPRYAVFEIEGVTSEPNQPEHPLQINDLGMVLYRKAVWVNGEVNDLVLETPMLTGCTALGMNNHGHIIGKGVLYAGIPVGSPYGGEVLVLWKCNKQPGSITFEDPIPAMIVEGNPPAVEHRAQTVWNVDTLNPPDDFPFDSLIDDKHRFVAFTETWVDQFNPTYERSVWKWDEVSGDFTRVPAESQDVSFTASADFAASPEVTWGNIDVGTEIYVNGQYDFVDEQVLRFTYRPNDRLTAVLKNREFQSQVANGTWVTTERQVNVVDISRSGTILRKLGNVWSNRSDKKFQELVAPETTAPWNDQTPLIDLSPQNWILGKMPIPTNNSYPAIASCPVIVLDDDNDFATGVDTHSTLTRESEDSEPGTPSGGKYWIMVPSGPNAAANPNTTKFKIPGAKHLQITVSADGASPASTTLTEDETLISWTSSSPGGTEIPLKFEIGAGANKQEAISKPVNLKVMKERELKVTIWHITLWANDGTHYPPQIQYEKADVIEELNRIYGKQANLWVSESSVVMKPPQVVAYDQWHIHGGPMTEDNDRFDYYGLVPTWEQEKIIAGGRVDANAHINVYVVGGEDEALFWKDSKDGNQTPAPDHHANGITNRPPREVWIDGFSVHEGEDLAEDIKDKLRTLSHEIGHVLIGGGHPNWFPPGPARYHKTDDMASERLMWTAGHNNPAIGDRLLLVKKEWDRIENSMNAIENGEDWPPENENPK